MLDWLFSEPLAVGTPAPDFSAPDQEGRQVSPAALRGVHNVVLVFYPGDETSGCRKQLCQFRDRWTLAEEKDTLVFGVNPQSAEKHRAFRDNHRFPFPLLVDERQRIAGLYHARGLIVKRTVYLIGKSGLIRFARRGMPPPEEVLASAE